MRAARAAPALAAVMLFAPMQGDAAAPHHLYVRYHYEVRKDLSTYFTNSDEIIEVIRQALVDKDKSITITYTSDKDSMADFAPIVRELFGFALEETDTAYEGDYLSCHIGGYELSYTRTGEGEYDYSLVITPTLYTTASQEGEITDEVRRRINSFGFDDSTPDYEKVSKIYDYIYNNVAYDRVHKNNPHYHLKNTAYGALIYKRAVCQGYAAAMYRLLREAGVGCRVITGMAGGEGLAPEYHAWNIICIDGKWYNCDVTWDIQNGSHEYFLKSDAEFSDHTRDEKYTTDSFLSSYKTAAESYALP